MVDLLQTCSVHVLGNFLGPIKTALAICCILSNSGNGRMHIVSRVSQPVQHAASVKSLRALLTDGALKSSTAIERLSGLFLHSCCQGS